VLLSAGTATAADMKDDGMMKKEMMKDDGMMKKEGMKKEKKMMEKKHM